MRKPRSADEANHGGDAPKAPKKPRRAATTNAFVRVTLEETHRADIRRNPLSVEAIDDALAKLFDDGYKLSSRYDEYSQCVTAWLIAPEDTGANAGRILAGRGSTYSKALRQLLYIHFVMAEDQVWSNLEVSPQWLFD